MLSCAGGGGGEDLIAHLGVSFWVLVGALVGAATGSFLECALYRWPRGLSVVRPTHSYCPACEVRLEPVDLVPILSWLRLGGRCRRCGAPIGYAAILLEAGGALAGAALVFVALTR